MPKFYFLVNLKGETIALDEHTFAVEIYTRPYGKIARLRYLGWKEVKELKEIENIPPEQLEAENLPKDRPPPLKKRLNLTRGELFMGSSSFR